MPIPDEPLCLSDAQLTTIMQLARPLQPAQRTVFLEMIAAKLNGQRELGDGAIYRLCRDLQRELFSPPTFGVDNGGNRSRAYRGVRRRIVDDDDSEDDRPRERQFGGQKQKMWG